MSDDNEQLTPMQRYYQAQRQDKEPDGWLPVTLNEIGTYRGGIADDVHRFDREE